MERTAVEQREFRATVVYNSLLEVEQDSHLHDEYQIYFAIDFAELFLYAHPLASTAPEFLYEFSNTPTEQEQSEALTRQRTALTFGFRDLPGPLVLLPPYAHELKSHFRAVRRDARSYAAPQNLPLLEFSRQRILEHINGDTQLKEALEQARRGLALTSAQKECLRTLLEEHYRGIWALLTLDEQGLKHIFKLLDTGRLRLLEEVFPDIKVSYEDIAEGATAWFGILKEHRANRPYQNNVDAYSCQYLYEMNRRMNRDRKMLILLSHSSTMQRTLTKKSFDNLLYWPKGANPVRDLRYIHTRLLCSNIDDRKYIDLRRVNTYLRETETFISHINKIKAQYGTENRGEEIKEQMDLIRSLQQAERNLSFFLRTDFSYLEEFAPRRPQSTEFAQASGMDSYVLRVLADSEEFKAVIAVRANALLQDMTQINQQLAALVSPDTATNDYSKYLQKLFIPESTPVRLGLDQFLYIPRLLESLEDRTRQVVEALLGQQRDSPLDKSSSRTDIVRNFSQLAVSPASPAAARAASAVCWLYGGEWRMAYGLVMTGLREASRRTPLWKELTLLRSLIKRNLDTEVQSIEKTLQEHLHYLVQEYYDPCAFLELGIWYLIEYRLTSASRTLDRAIDYIKMSFQRVSSDSYLRYYITNKLTYALIEKNEAWSLGESESLLNELLLVLDTKKLKQLTYLEGSLAERFEQLIFISLQTAVHDTAGALYARQAVKSRGTSESFVLQSKAIKELQAALQDSKCLLPWEGARISQHLDEARRV